MGVLARMIAIVDWWIPRYVDARDHETVLVYRYYQFLCAIIAGFFVVFSLNSARLGLYALAMAQAVVLLIIFASVAAYRRTRSLTIAANVILGFTAPVTCYRLYILGGLDSPILFGWPIISTLALMTLPISWTLLWTAVHLAFAAFFYLAPGVVPAVAPEKVATIGYIRIAMIVSVQVIFYCSVLIIRRLNARLRDQLSLQNAEVTNVVRTLVHDLSSPLMTLKFWLQSALKKDPSPELLSLELLTKIQRFNDRLLQVKADEAHESGKAGGTNARRTPEVELVDGLFRFVALTLGAVAGSLATYELGAGQSTLAATHALVALVSLAAWGVYLKTTRAAAAAHVVLAASLAALTAQAYLLGGITSPTFLAWPLVPVLAGALLPLPHAAAWAAAHAVVALAFDQFARFGPALAAVDTIEHARQLRLLTLGLVQCAVLATIYYLKAQNRYVRDLVDAQRGRRLDLLKVLTKEVGDPLREVRGRLEALGPMKNVEAVLRSVRACLEVIEHTERWVNSAQSEEASVVDLRQVVEEVGFLQESIIRSKGVVFAIEITGDSAPLVLAGKTSLAYQILNNLVSNAIKFTPEGGRVVVRVGPGRDAWSLTVEDSGIGIPAALLERIFDPHKPTTREGTNGETGTGFGMPIVKMFVEKFHGSIHIESRPRDQYPHDHGTRIRIDLPTVRREPIEDQLGRTRGG